MKIDARNAACSVDHKMSDASEAIVKFLYICIIEGRAGCA
jgi:hypothetical protein